MSAALLEVEGLDLYYGDAQALAGVSLEVAKGEIVAIVGANGAGKSSLIRTIAGIEKPSRGPHHASTAPTSPAGRAIASASSASARSPRAARCFPTSRCSRISRWARRCRARARRREADARARLTMFPRLAERRRQAAGTLSGGEQQMLAIGRCLMGQPEPHHVRRALARPRARRWCRRCSASSAR